MQDAAGLSIPVFRKGVDILNDRTRIRLEADVATLVRKTIMLNCAPPNAPLWTHDAISQRVREIIADQMGLDLSQVKPEHHLIQDLGMG